LEWFTPGEYLIAAIFSLCPALWCWALYRVRKKRALKHLAGLGVGLALVFLVFAVTLQWGVKGEWGLAMRAGEVLNEPSPASGDVIFTLSEGALVRIKESRMGWHRVEDEKGRIGWARLSEVRILR
jgi:hypothetical protein